MSKSDKSKYGVFIIESMDIHNEMNKKLDGWTLKQTLDLCGIANMYFYIRTVIELENIIKIFEKSQFRYLHISCHGNAKELCLTYESVSFEELDLLIGPSLFHKRLFLSACKVSRFALAEHFIPKYHCHSVIGSPDNIDYDKAAVFWSSFYYLMYKCDESNMYQINIMPLLMEATKLFSLKLNYYSIINNLNKKSWNHLREIKYDSGEIIKDSILKTKFQNIYRESIIPTTYSENTPCS